MKRILDGTVYCDALRKMISDGVDLGENPDINDINDNLLDRGYVNRHRKLLMNAVEYREVCSLGQSINADLMDLIECVKFKDFDMCYEYMEYIRKNKRDLDEDILRTMKKCHKKFGLNMLDMFKFMMNDESGEYLNGIIDLICKYDWETNDDDETEYWNVGDRSLSFVRYQIETVMNGNLMNLKSSEDDYNDSIRYVKI